MVVERAFSTSPQKLQTTIIEILAVLVKSVRLKVTKTVKEYYAFKSKCPHSLAKIDLKYLFVIVSLAWS